MPAPPLTHHEIIGLAEPFTRRGRHVDLAASQRAERRLVFKPPAAPGDHAADPALHESLQLECFDGGVYRLTRRLRGTDGQEASLQAQGGDAGVLLARVEQVPLDLHFVRGAGYTIARSYVLDVASAGEAAVPRLERGRVQVDGLALTLTLPAHAGVAADIRLDALSADALVLPEDLLAVLGWNWARLLPDRRSWASKLRMPRRAQARTARAEAALQVAAVHLARTLAEPPARYHERLARARWGVFFRRGIPALTGLALLVSVAVLAVTTHYVPERPMGLWYVFFHLPTALLALSFCLQELARLEIPPLPRPLAAARWVAAGPTGVPEAN
jgi:hypothetical protein